MPAGLVGVACPVMRAAARTERTFSELWIVHLNLWAPSVRLLHRGMVADYARAAQLLQTQSRSS